MLYTLGCCECKNADAPADCHTQCKTADRMLQLHAEDGMTVYGCKGDDGNAGKFVIDKSSSQYTKSAQNIMTNFKASKSERFVKFVDGKGYFYIDLRKFDKGALLNQRGDFVYVQCPFVKTSSKHVTIRDFHETPKACKECKASSCEEFLGQEAQLLRLKVSPSLPSTAPTCRCPAFAHLTSILAAAAHGAQEDDEDLFCKRPQNRFRR